MSVTQTINEPNQRKRQAIDSITLSEDDADESFPRFLVVEAISGNPIDYSIFTIQKLLQCAVGNVKTAKKLRSGAVLIEVDNKRMASRALDMKNWLNTEVKVSPHRSLNSCRGVIRCRDFKDCADDEVLDALRSQGVTSVKHIMIKKGDKSEPSNTFILTFSAPTPPKFVKAAYLRIPVDVFVPNPLRCYKCQKFGHGRDACKRPAACAKCGGGDHVDTECHEDPHCVNCGSDHTCYSKECPEWTKQREISKVKHERQVTFSEAKNIVEAAGGFCCSWWRFICQGQRLEHNSESYNPIRSLCKRCNAVCRNTD